MASFNPVTTMSFTKWFAIMDYVVSLGFEVTPLATDLSSVTSSPILKGSDRIGLVGIQSPDNGKTVTHVMGWDMSVKLKRYPASTNMGGHAGILSSSRSYDGMPQPSVAVPNPYTVQMGTMANNYSELKNQESKQSSIMFAFGEWFDGVQAQVSAPSMFKSIDFDDSKGKGEGALAKPLKLITPFENAFDHLGLPKKLLKQLTDSSTGLLARAKNSNLPYGKEWMFNSPYIFAYQLAVGTGIAYSSTDRKKMLNYFYNQSNLIQDRNTPKAKEYSGPRPFRYFGYPQTSILAIMKHPSIALATVSGEVDVKIAADDYYYSDNGSAPEWQTMADPSAIVEFSPVGGRSKVVTSLMILRALSQWKNAGKASKRMRINKVAPPPSGTKLVFPSLTQTTNPDYGNLNFWTAGQKSPGEFASIITAVADDPTPNMATQMGAAPQAAGTPAPTGKSSKPSPVATLTASKGAKPSKPKRDFSPDGVKVTITNFHKKDVFNMEKSWLVLNITPDQAIYNKIMKDWEKGEKGSMKKRVTPPKNYIKQYPKIVQLAFKAGTTLLINTNGKTKPEWKEYKWNRGADAITVSKDSRFTFIDNDPRKGMTFALRTSLGTIDVKRTYDEANQPVTTIGEWFKDGATEMKVEVGRWSV